MKGLISNSINSCLLCQVFSRAPIILKVNAVTKAIFPFHLIDLVPFDLLLYTLASGNKNAIHVVVIRLKNYQAFDSVPLL